MKAFLLPGKVQPSMVMMLASLLVLALGLRAYFSLIRCAYM